KNMRVNERSSTAEPAGEPDAQGGPEALLDGRVEEAEHVVEDRPVDGADGHGAVEEHRVLEPDGEGGTDEPDVAPEEVLVERPVVLLGGGHDVGLVVEG